VYARADRPGAYLRDLERARSKAARSPAHANA